MFSGFSAPKIRGVLMKTFSKPSFTHFFTLQLTTHAPKLLFWPKKLAFLAKKMQVVGEGGSQTLDHLPKNPETYALLNPAP